MLPPDAQPPDHPRGQFSYTLPMTLGKYNLKVRIEVLVRAKGFRVTSPFMTRQEEPLCPWGDDIDAAWKLVLEKALKKAESLRDAGKAEAKT
eukprot:3679417-Pyramimonas_sp.AAC.1